jgi:hypothetical protein
MFLAVFAVGCERGGPGAIGDAIRSAHAAAPAAPPRPAVDLTGHRVAMDLVNTGSMPSSTAMGGWWQTADRRAS